MKEERIERGGWIVNSRRMSIGRIAVCCRWV